MIRKRKVNYHCIYCLCIGILLGIIFSNSKKESNAKDQIEIKMNVIKDSVVFDTMLVKKQVITKKLTSNRTLPLNEKNLKKVLSDNNVHHAHIVLAQAKLETGNFSSKVCKTKNNLFGLRKGNTYRNYSHWSESVKAYKKLIQSKYKGGNYYSFLDRIGYAGDKSYTTKLKGLA